MGETKSMGTPITLTLPPGRLIGGDLYTPNTKDAEGNPLTIKNGPNKGQPREDYFALYAIPKGNEQHWAHTDWGQKLYQIGAAAFPQAVQRPDFAWKIIDGDSTIPNKNGKVPATQPGHAKHWVLKLSSGFASQVVVAQNGQWVQQLQKDFAKPGDYVQAQVVANDNGSSQQSGIYINHRMFAFLGHGERIASSGPDANAAGFAMGHLPTGASATPLAAMPMPAAPGAPAAPAIPGLPPAPGAPAVIAPPPVPTPAQAAADPLVGVPGAAHTVASLRAGGWTDDQIVAGGYATRAAAPAPAPLPPAISVPAPVAPAAAIAPVPPVTPNPAFAQIPPAAPAAPAVPQLTAAGVAAGGSYDAFRTAGWSDDALRGAGYLA
jgi:hypothetical protein